MSTQARRVFGTTLVQARQGHSERVAGPPPAHYGGEKVPSRGKGVLLFFFAFTECTVIIRETACRSFALALEPIPGWFVWRFSTGSPPSYRAYSL